MWRLHMGKPADYLTKERPDHYPAVSAPLTCIHNTVPKHIPNFCPTKTTRYNKIVSLSQKDTQEMTKQVHSPKPSKQENIGFNYRHIGGDLLLILLPILENLP